MAEAIIFRTGVKLPDGDHLLPCGATITVKGGVPVKLVTPLAHFDHSLAMTEAETFAGLWLYFDDDDDADEEPGGAWIVVVGEVQPTHRFHGDAQGPREVRLVELDIAGSGARGGFSARSIGQPTRRERTHSAGPRSSTGRPCAAAGPAGPVPARARAPP